MLATQGCISHHVALPAAVKTRYRSFALRCTVISRAVDATERVGLKFASSAVSLAIGTCAEVDSYRIWLNHVESRLEQSQADLGSVWHICFSS